MILRSRTAVIDFLNELDPKEDYAIVFFDVNDLKKANDAYGHETGDLLIKNVAHLLEKAFNEKDGFVGRYGGDEFVAGFFSNSKKSAEQAVREFYNSIQKFNEKKILPFEVNVAYGIFNNDPIFPVPQDEGIKKADDYMYKMKKEMKKMNTEMRE